MRSSLIASLRIEEAWNPLTLDWLNGIDYEGKGDPFLHGDGSETRAPFQRRWNDKKCKCVLMFRQNHSVSLVGDAFFVWHCVTILMSWGQFGSGNVHVMNSPNLFAGITVEIYKVGSLVTHTGAIKLVVRSNCNDSKITEFEIILPKTPLLHM